MRPHRATVSRMLAAGGIVALWLAIPGAAHAGTLASMTAKFTPEKLGAATTLSLGFELSGGSQLPQPLTAVDFRYPPDLGFVTSGLGVASCAPAELEEHGPAVCPANSLIGHGTAQAKIPFGSEVLSETAEIALVAGPSQEGYVSILICATGLSPVATRVVMPTLLLAGRLHISVPLVPSLPGAPDVSVVRIQVTLGGKLTYYERIHGKMVAYHPKGIGLPRRCPRGGFHFESGFTLADGSHARAKTEVRCPTRR
jgi:hypothetical protein